jgi:hypothetical protein
MKVLLNKNKKQGNKNNIHAIICGRGRDVWTVLGFPAHHLENCAVHIVSPSVSEDLS